MTKILLSLPQSEDNAYQRLLGRTATAAARRLGVDVCVEYACGDINKQWAHYALASSEHFDAVISMPLDDESIANRVGEVLANRIPFWILNRTPDYVAGFQTKYPDVPLAVVSPDQTEVGRIQARQTIKLLGNKGSILYVVHGFAKNGSSVMRSQGMEEGLKGSGVSILSTINGRWESERAKNAMNVWIEHRMNSTFRLPNMNPDLVVCQSEGMVPGVEEALKAAKDEVFRNMPVIGCDGTPEFKQAVDSGLRRATVELPLTSETALSQAIEWIQKRKQPPKLTTLAPQSYPALEFLKPIKKQAGAA